jgi:hypothetical protein
MSKYFSLRDELMDRLDLSFVFDTFGDVTYGNAYKLILDFHGKDAIVTEGISGFVDVEYYPTMVDGKRNQEALDQWAEYYNEECDWKDRFDAALAPLQETA